MPFDITNAFIRNAFSPLWTRLCLVNSTFDLNVFWHKRHWNGFCVLWLRLCLFKWLHVENTFWHKEHWKGFSPLWVRLCVVKLLDVENAFSHKEHWNGFTSHVAVSGPVLHPSKQSRASFTSTHSGLGAGYTSNIAVSSRFNVQHRVLPDKSVFLYLFWWKILGMAVARNIELTGGRFWSFLTKNGSFFWVAFLEFFVYKPVF